MKRFSRVFSIFLVICLLFGVAVIASATAPADKTEKIRNYDFEDGSKTFGTSYNTASYTLSNVDSKIGNRYLRFVNNKTATARYNTGFLIGTNAMTSTSLFNSGLNLKNVYDYYTVDFDLSADQCYVFVGYKVEIAESSYKIEEVYKTYSNIDEKVIETDISATFSELKSGISECIEKGLITGFADADAFLKTTEYVKDADAAELSSSVNVSDALASKKLSYSNNMEFALENRVLYNDALKDSGANSLKVKLTYNQSDARWHFTVANIYDGDVVNNSGIEFVLADGVGEWNHFTYVVKVNHETPGLSRAQLYYNGYLIGTSCINIYASDTYRLGATNIGPRGIYWTITDYAGDCSMGIDNFVSTFYKTTYSSGSADGIDDLFDENSALESVSQCTDVVYNKDYNAPAPSNQFKINGKAIGVPWLANEALKKIGNNSTVTTDKDLLNLNSPVWSSYDIMCGSGVKATLSSAAKNNGVTIDETSYGYRVNGVSKYANMSLFTDMQFNLYLPKVNGIKITEVSGEAWLEEGTVTIEGVEMYVVSGISDVWSFAPLKAKIKYEENGLDLEYTATLDTIEYATLVTNEFECGSDEATLIYEMIEYKKAASEYLERDINEEDLEKLSAFYALFEEHQRCTCSKTAVNISASEKNTDYSALKNAGVTGISYDISLDKSGVVIHVNAGVTVNSVTYKGNDGKDVIHSEENGNLIYEDGYYVVSGVSAANIDAIMTIRVGDAVGSYCLGKYIVTNPNVEIAKNLYKYSLAAEDYKNVTIQEICVSVSSVKHNSSVGDTYYVEGYCVFVSDGEITLRDINTDESVSLRGVPAGYMIGDRIIASSVVANDGDGKYLVFSNKNPEDITRTIVSRGNDVSHAHEYSGEWLTTSTIFEAGIEYRECSYQGCAERESRLGKRLEVITVSVTQAPNKTVYELSEVGESYDIAGMVVKAYDMYGREYDVTNLISVANPTVSSSDTEIEISYAGKSAFVEIRVLLERIAISELKTKGTLNNSYTVEGYFVGVANEGVFSTDKTSDYAGDRELLIKDIETDDIIAVRNIPYGSFPDYGYKKGDRIIINATYKKDTTVITKRYLDFTSDNPDNIDGTIISSGNKIEFKLDNVTTISTWDEWKAFFNDSNDNCYTYVKLATSELFVDRESHSGGSYAWRLHPIAAASSTSAVKSDSRWTVVNANITTSNLGSQSWSGYFQTMTSTDPRYNSSHCQRVCLADEVYVLYTGACNYYFSLTILDDYWFVFNDEDNSSYTNAEVVIEVAKAYDRRGKYIQYNQTMSRRHINPSPEDATAQNMVYLDCSSFVNAVYYEAFGVNVMPYALDYTIEDVAQTPQTGRFRNYARDNQGNADVVGYWEIENYDGDVVARLSEIKGMLEIGDVINYRKAGDSAGHVLIYIGGTAFIHCSGGDYKVFDDASQSYDYGDEKANGAVYIESNYMNTLFEDTSHDRYLGKVYDVCIIRPLARGLTPTEKTEARMAMKGVTFDKTVDVGTSSAVYKNGELTYSVTVTNNGESIEYFTLRDVICDNVSFVSGSHIDRLTVDGNVLTWNLRVGVGSSVTVSWTVRVNEDAKSGSIIDGTNTTVNGIAVTKTVNTVSAYTAEEMALLVQKAKEYAAASKSFNDPMLMAKELYREVFGIDVFGEDITAVKALLEDIIDATNESLNTESELCSMVAPYLYGGRDIATLYIQNNDIVRLITNANISVGDVICAYDRSESRTVVYIYVGDSTLVAIDSADNTCKTVTMSDSPYEASHVLVTLFAYDLYAVIRPSMK